MGTVSLSERCYPKGLLVTRIVCHNLDLHTNTLMVVLETDDPDLVLKRIQDFEEYDHHNSSHVYYAQKEES